MKFVEAPLYGQQISIILFILTLVLSIMDLFIAIRIYKKILFKIITVFFFVFSFLSIFLTMQGSYLYRMNRPVFELSLTIIQWPFILILSLSIFFFIMAISLLLYGLIKGNQSLSSVSIKESVDMLPKGICFYEKSGLVRLINREMNNLSVLILGEALLNGTNFWHAITNGKIEKDFYSLKKGEEPIIGCRDGKVISFKRNTHFLNGHEIYEIIATDITEEYCLMEELEKKRVKLKAVNERLISYGKNVSQLAREKEVLMAKIRIHDDIGKLLLITKQKLTNDMKKEDQKELLSFWEVEIEALKSTSTLKKKSNLQVILEAAQLVNVAIEFKGNYPTIDSVTEKILIQAMHECLTNTVSHANGKKMLVELENGIDEFVIRITNDGQKPKGKIIEGGGLSSLRSLIEKENGKMIVKSEPQFELIIQLLKGAKQ